MTETVGPIQEFLRSPPPPQRRDGRAEVRPATIMPEASCQQRGRSKDDCRSI